MNGRKRIECDALVILMGIKARESFFFWPPPPPPFSGIAPAKHPLNCVFIPMDDDTVSFSAKQQGIRCSVSAWTWSPFVKPH